MPTNPTNQTDPILTRLLEDLPSGWRVSQLYLGPTFSASFIENTRGEHRIGLAALPGSAPAEDGFLQLGFNRLDFPEAGAFSLHALSSERVKTSAGLATLNALLQPEPALLSPIDAGDWLVEEGRGRKIALVGRFPFIDELVPVVGKLWVFELDPQPGEYGFCDAPEIVPQADILAVTGSSLLNHSLQDYLALANSATQIIVLGPSTPLSPRLFEFGVHVLSGVLVDDEAALLESISNGLSFRRMKGTKRVSLVRPGF
jgi:uncharacterized protein (DUF4213/DUF364 family)